MSEEKASNEQPQKKEKKREGGGGAPAWMVTYSDLVTLLLTFFVLLLSMANMDPVKFLEVSSSLRDAFGIHAKPIVVDPRVQIIPTQPHTKFIPVQQEMTTKVYRKLKTQIDTQNLSQDIDVFKTDDNTIVLRIKESVLFEPGQTKVSPKSYPLLRHLADIIRPLPMRLRIEGHTDSTQSTLELNKWDTSVARSVSVMRFLKKGNHLPLDRLAAAGYGDSKPVATNKTEEGRAKNRRVDFILRAESSFAKNRRDSGVDTKIPF